MAVKQAGPALLKKEPWLAFLVLSHLEVLPELILKMVVNIPALCAGPWVRTALCAHSGSGCAEEPPESLALCLVSFMEHAWCFLEICSQET